ncbi:MAG: IS66 family transposase [Carbonactinosporaceae bacterium]
MSGPEQPSYAELAAQVEVQDGVIAELRALVEVLQGEVAALRRQVGCDSSNSSQPPGKDGPAASPRSLPRGRGGRRPGGQKGRRGTGLERVAVPDHVRRVEPDRCGGCGAGLVGAPGAIASAVGVFDIAPIAVSVRELQMMRRTCTDCGTATSAAAPAEVSGGPACYGPNVVAATTLLASSDVIGIERAAQLMAALLAAPVSTGFVSRCLVRLDDRLVAAGFEEAVKAGLRAAAVIGTDETPANVAEPGNHHVYTVRTMRAHTGGGADLVWSGAADNRGHDALDAFDILEGHQGVLVRDDYGGYTKFDAHLTGVQQCCSHLFRHLADVHDIDADQRAWTDQAAGALRAAGAAVNAARQSDPTATALDADLLARLRRDYDQAVAVGISTNLSRRWHRGRHPGLVLAQRLQRKADQVWLFATRFDVPWTNNGSEQAVRGVKVHQKISSCWRTLATLQRHCRIRSYLTTTRNHGLAALTAIRRALTGTTWIPPLPS